MTTVTEDTLKLPDGIELYRKTWHPAGAPVAKLIHIHGYSEHINRYYDFFPSLAARGIECTGVDQRGWGKSAATKKEQGNTGPTAQILSDIAVLIKENLPSTVPIFLSGHSMGGGEVIALASTPAHADLISQVRGILLIAPYIATIPEETPSGVTVFFGRLAGKLLPHQKITRVIQPPSIVRDPEIQKSLADDELCHNTGTLEMFSNMLQRTSDIANGVYQLSPGVKSLWLGHGTADKSVDYDASKKWFEEHTKNVKDREFKTYPEWSHQLHVDLPENREIFLNDVSQWILKRCEVTEGSKL